MDNPDMTMEEYIQYETEKALKTIMYITGKLLTMHVDEFNWKNKTSLSEYNDGKYNAISENVLGIDKDLFSYDIFSIDKLKLDKDDDEGKIGIKQSSEDIFVELLCNGINIDVDTYEYVSNMLWEISHDT
ncbi:hypothetical protein Tco_0116739 [Tanacetum coccineum]